MPLVPVCVRYVDVPVIVTVIVPVAASTLRLYSVENMVLAEATSIVIAGTPVKMKFPPVAERIVVDAIVIDATDVVLKITLVPVVVMELPDAEIRFVPESAPATVKPVAAEVIVEDTTDRVKVVSVERNTMESDDVAVNTVDDCNVIPMAVAVDWKFTLFAEVAVNVAPDELMPTTFAES